MRVVNTERLPIKIWAEDIEDGAMQQARNMANLPFAHRWIALMPDCHQGYGMPIGGVLATRDVIVPNAVGVDIGCGMIAMETNVTDITTEQIKEIMGTVRGLVPVGFTHHATNQGWDGFDRAPDIEIIQQELESARKQLGTLGGGNHFMEIQKGDDGNIWLMIHSGSRNFGFKTANVYHKKAQALCERWYSSIPDKDLSFLPMDTVEGMEYFEAMNYCLDFARASRVLMMGRFSACFAHTIGNRVTSCIHDIHHNYADLEHHHGENVLVHRKGATRARAGETGIIPGSMGTASYITVGLGNEESFMSCSHGAGRRMGRKEASRTLNLEDEISKMGNIVHGLRTVEDLDEASGAYKDIDAVMANQGDLTRIVVRLTPLGVIKG